MKRIIQLGLVAALFLMAASAGAYDVKPRYVHFYNSSTGQHYTMATKVGTNTNQVYRDINSYQQCTVSSPEIADWRIARCKTAAITANHTSVHWIAIHSDLDECECGDGNDWMDCDSCSDSFEPYVTSYLIDWGYWAWGNSYVSRISLFYDECPTLNQYVPYPWGGGYIRTLPNYRANLYTDYG